jgi:hypothetical protein
MALRIKLPPWSLPAGRSSNEMSPLSRSGIMIRSVRASGVVPHVLILNKELEVTTTEGGEPGKDAAIAFTLCEPLVNLLS